MYSSFLRNIQTLQDKTAPYLLGLSGGVDSMLLYEFLKKAGFLNLHVAHIDHRWSKKSSFIAENLKQLALRNDDVFHLHEIDTIAKHDSNVEDLCRIERLKFFSLVYKRAGARALFLAHHADDQVEVVLKRIFEGSYITNCSGMDKEGVNFDMTVLRPFLCCKKKSILDWANKNAISFFDDPTNSDLRFLRARFRKEIITNLETAFKKPIKNSVLQISFELKEIEEFLELDFQNNAWRCKKLDKGFVYETDSISNAQLRFAIKKICKNLGEVINREQMRIILKSVTEKKSNNRVILSKHVVIYKKNYLNFNLINQ